MAGHTMVVALGGNALAPAGELGTIASQFRHTRESLAPIVDLAREGWRIAIVHGNGPQVGDSLARNELAAAEVEPLPLGVLVAETAGLRTRRARPGRKSAARSPPRMAHSASSARKSFCFRPTSARSSASVCWPKPNSRTRLARPFAIRCCTLAISSPCR